MKISVLTPAWNEAAFLDEMIESLVRQAHQDWELLLVDDGSTDETSSKIEAWAARDQRVRAVSLGVKMGKVAAFNLAFRASTGDVICLCGADDTMPLEGLSARARVLSVYSTERAAAYFKLRTFSEDPKFDGGVLPRGNAGSRSGGSMTMTRPLAQIVFPIPENLPAEDIWLAHSVDAVAEHQIDDPTIVLNYRIHGGNSNPRHQDFAKMNESLHRRMQALNEVLEQERFPVPAAQRERLELMARAEELRYAGKTVQVLRLSRLPIIERLGVAQASNPTLRKVRDRFYVLASGWRGR